MSIVPFSPDPSAYPIGGRLDRLLTIQEVKDATSLSRATIYRMVSAGTLPAPIKIGKSRIAWRASSLGQWLSERPLAA